MWLITHAHYSSECGHIAVARTLDDAKAHVDKLIAQADHLLEGSPDWRYDERYCYQVEEIDTVEGTAT